MARYFLEVAYKGTAYSGFQVQENAKTIQSEIEHAFRVLHRETVTLTGSSRTDAGVHARQNYFHFDFMKEVHPQFLYKMNALLPPDIVMKQLHPVKDESHCRFDALAREYRYFLYRQKDPFLRDTAYYYPYALRIDRMQEAAEYVKKQQNFFAFSKTNTQVKNFDCRIMECEWKEEGDQLVFHISANRFLRGMVRLLTATLLKLGREKLSMQEFQHLFSSRETKCHLSVPPHGLFLERVHYPENYFPATGAGFS